MKKSINKIKLRTVGNILRKIKSLFRSKERDTVYRNNKYMEELKEALSKDYTNL